MTDMYDLARQVTDEVFGEGAYADLNKNNPDPGVQRAIKKGAPEDSITEEDFIPCMGCGAHDDHNGECQR